MPLKHALLGFLSYQPMTGYDLKQHFDRSIYYFWNAKLSQIYPALNRMRENGWLTMEVDYQEDRPNRKVYHITEAGRGELQRWQQEPTDVSSIREPFLIKVFFGGRLEQGEILAQLRHQMRLHQEQLTAYHEKVREAVQQNVEATGMVREGVFWGLTLDMGIRYEQGWIEWCEEAIDKIESIDKELMQ
ncbi:MAG: PadR family transcriptional regulator [Anaerolineaceae bacterium]|nr:PadR family transcriptional regulator [Anaerolineaceae bacterium]